MQRLPQSNLIRYSVAVLSVTLALFITLNLVVIQQRSPFVLFLLAVFISTWFGGRFPGVLATVLSAVVAEYLVIAPDHYFLSDLGGFLQILVFISIAALVNWLTILYRREKSNREAGERSKFLFENHPIPMWVFDLKTLRFLDVNDAAVHYYGYSRDEFLAMTISDIRPPEDVSLLLENVASIESAIEPIGVWRHRRKDGTLLDVEIVAHGIDYEGRPARLILAIDVTERERASAAARESEMRLLEVFGSCPVAVLINRWSDRVFVDVNSEFTTLTGWTLDDVIGRTTVEIGLVDESTSIELKAEIEEQTSLLDREVEIQTRSGEKRSVIMGCVFVDMMGERHLVTTFVDITDRKKAVQELRSERNLLRTVFDLLPDYIYVKDGEGRFVDCNEATARLMGAPSRIELLGKTDMDYYPSDVASIYRADELRVLAGEPLISKEEPIVLSNGDSEIILTTKLPIRDDDSEIKGIVGYGRNITAARRAEQSIRESETRYRTLFDYSPDGIVIADQESYYQDANSTMCQMLGYTRDELIRLHASDIVSEFEVPYIGEALDTLNAKQDYQREWLFRRKDGGQFSGEVVATQMPDGNLMAVIRDVTDRKRSEQLIVESETKLSGIIESAMDAIISIDSQRYIVLFNKAAESMFRCTAADALGRKIEDFIPERFRASHGLHVNNFGKANVTRRSMGRLGALYGLRSDGEEFPIEASISHLETNGQKFYTVILRDITERQLAAAAAAHLAAIVEYSDDAIIGVDLETIVTSWNAGAEKILGFSAEEMVGRSITILLPAGRENEEVQILDRIKRAESLSHFDTVRLRKSGDPIEVSITVSAIRDHDGNIVGVSKVVRDVTDRRRAENEIRELNEHLEQRVIERTAQLDAVNHELEAFSYSVSHDLRAPLRHVDGFVQMLIKREAGKLDETSERYLKVVSDATIKMGTLIDELLAFSRTSRQEVHWNRVTLEKLVNDARYVLSPSMDGRNIEWSVEEIPDVEGDPTLLGIVISNLISNAIKYSRNEPAAHIEIGAMDEDEGSLTFFVRDNGSGFDMEYVDKMFGVFQRLHREEEFEGIGIGLATVKRIIDRHGGKIWAEGEVGRGATFYITFRKYTG